MAWMVGEACMVWYYCSGHEKSSHYGATHLDPKCPKIRFYTLKTPDIEPKITGSGACERKWSLNWNFFS